MKKQAKKPAAKKAAPVRKAARKVAPAKTKEDKAKQLAAVKTAYRKAIDIVIKVNEMMVRGEKDDDIDEILDQIADQRKILDGNWHNDVIGRLLHSVTIANTVDIDEASPGSKADWG